MMYNHRNETLFSSPFPEFFRFLHLFTKRVTKNEKREAEAVIVNGKGKKAKGSKSFDSFSYCSKTMINSLMISVLLTSLMKQHSNGQII